MLKYPTPGVIINNVVLVGKTSRNKLHPGESEGAS